MFTQLMPKDQWLSELLHTVKVSALEAHAILQKQEKAPMCVLKCEYYFAQPWLTLTALIKKSTTSQDQVYKSRQRRMRNQNWRERSTKNPAGAIQMSG